MTMATETTPTIPGENMLSFHSADNAATDIHRRKINVALNLIIIITTKATESERATSASTRRGPGPARAATSAIYYIIEAFWTMCRGKRGH